MARTTNQTAAAPHSIDTDEPRTNEGSQHDEHDENGNENGRGDTEKRAERRTQGITERNDRNQLGEKRENRELGQKRDSHDLVEGQEHSQLTDRVQDLRREQNPAFPAGVDAFGPVLDAWKQIFSSGYELMGIMVKMQQEAFASMVGIANSISASNGAPRIRDYAMSASRETDATPDHDRR